MSATVYILIAILVYLVGMLVIGGVYSKGNNSSGDFYLGGRRLGPVVTAMSTEASDMSGWLLMGLPGVAYFTGLADATWTAIGLAVGTYLNWLFVAKRLRLYSSRIDAITIPDFFAKRYHDPKLIEGIAAIVVIVFFIPYTASGFAACGKLFTNLFSVNYMTAMLISAFVIVAYCAMGGFMAASVTSLVQSIVMTLALVIVLWFGIATAGGWDAVVANAKGVAGYFSLHSLGNVATGEASNYGFITICSTLAWGLGYFGMPHILLHFMAAEDENKLKISRRIGTTWVVISMAVAVTIGIVGYAMSKVGVIDTFPSGSAAEAVIVKIAGLLSTHGVVPALLAGVILAGILASTMSTADAQLLAAASGITQNILIDVFGVKMSDKKNMAVARCTVVLVAVLGVVLARDPNSSVFAIVSFAWAGFGAAFGPVMLASLFWKRSNRYGALAGMISGGAMVFIWKYLVRPLGGGWNIYELLPAFLVSGIFIVAVSLLTPAPEKEIVEEYESVKA
ncbi:MAG TPA: sodium/proline symporter [Oscillospiraceae bacterium]|nr:sodium/proline symporter [Oscillospiraceae bacterium]HPS75777.1 sodium/proline symporter [Oscillospiraceae bacterium]